MKRSKRGSTVNDQGLKRGCLTFITFITKEKGGINAREQIEWK